MYNLQIPGVGKSKTLLNLQLNNHRKDVKYLNTNEGCKHFYTKKHCFNKYTKLTLIEQLKNI